MLRIWGEETSYVPEQRHSGLRALDLIMFSAVHLRAPAKREECVNQKLGYRWGRHAIHKFQWEIVPRPCYNIVVALEIWFQPQGWTDHWEAIDNRIFGPPPRIEDCNWGFPQERGGGRLASQQLS